MPDADRPTLSTARTSVEVCEAVARWCWWEAHDGAECPPTRVPTLADMAAWTAAGAPEAARAEAAERLTALVPPDWQDARGKGAGAKIGPTHLLGEPAPAGPWHVVPDRVDLAEAARYMIVTGLTRPSMATVGAPSLDLYGRLVADAHRRWTSGPHPLAPLVAAWQRRPSHRQARALVNRGSLPRLSRLGADDATLPDFPLQDAPAAPGGQLDLPGFGDAVRGCASWLLWLFDQAGGESLASGRGAPWDLRLFVYALLHLDVADRDGEWHTIRLPTDTVTGWLHPNGWANERRDWDKLPEALRRMSRELSYVPVDGIGYVAMLFPSVIPAKRGDPLVEFTARVPRVAAHGDRLHWPHLLAYGADSARLFRAYLAVTAWLGRSAKRGHPITRQIAAPVHGPDGKPTRRRKGGAIIRSATERIDNPAARYVGPPLSETDLTRMIGFDPSNRKLRQYARAAFERMEADGVIEIERSGAGWLLFGGPNG